jgi:hypothetical protein
VFQLYVFFILYFLINFFLKLQKKKKENINLLCRIIKIENFFCLFFLFCKFNESRFDSDHIYFCKILLFYLLFSVFFSFDENYLTLGNLVLSICFTFTKHDFISLIFSNVGRSRVDSFNIVDKEFTHTTPNNNITAVDIYKIWRRHVGFALVV